MSQKIIQFQMQETRRKIVFALWNEKEVSKEDVETLHRAYEKLTDKHTHAFVREMCTITAKLSLNIKDETRGLEVCFHFSFFFKNIIQAYNDDG